MCVSGSADADPSAAASKRLTSSAPSGWAGRGSASGGESEAAPPSARPETALIASVKTPGPVSSRVYAGSAGRRGGGFLNFSTMASNVSFISGSPCRATMMQFRYCGTRTMSVR